MGKENSLRYILVRSVRIFRPVGGGKIEREGGMGVKLTAKCRK